MQQLADVGRRRTALDNGVRDLRIRVEDLTAEQKRADADVEQVKARRVRDQGMVDSGAISDPKALERMLDELRSLNRRISDLEDVELEVMQSLEDTQGELAEQQLAVEALAEQQRQLQETADTTAGSLQTDLAGVRSERAASAEGMPEDLMTLYARLREQKGGVGAAALLRRQCTGCRLALNASDLGAIAKAPADDVLRCEECNRILVRTAESGL